MGHFFTLEEAFLDPFQLLTVKSPSLNKRADITVFNPGIKNEIGKSLPLVILLHGVYGSHWSWSLKGRAHEKLLQLIQGKKIRPMVLAMPSDGLFGDGSAYVPHKSGDYESWIVQDVVRAVKERNAQVDDSSPVFITGLSMGGFGALRLGAKYPDLFHGFSGLSSLTHFNQMNLFLENFEDLKNHALQQDGVLDWMSANKTKLSPFRFDCGSKDFLLEQNRVLHNSLLELGIPHLYEENEGKHEWDYWTKHIDTSFVFFDSLIS